MKPNRKTWLPDELILALDLYDREGWNPGPKSLEELSSQLRSIPIEIERAEDPSFRSAGAVARRLLNFVWLDPDADGGFANGGRGAARIWEEFADDKARLATTAAAIRANLATLDQREAEEPDEDEAEAEEGAILTRVHKHRERSSKLRGMKLAQVEKETGRLACEACDLDFGERYGSHGAGFIEVHHIRAVHTLLPGERTKLADLALLCSNCHRMVHVRRPWLSVERLREILEEGDGTGTEATAVP